MYYKCDIEVNFKGLEIDITTFNQKNHNSFPSFEIIVILKGNILSQPIFTS